MMAFCMRLGGGSQETLMLELLLSFTVVTVTALGGALGTERRQVSTIHLNCKSQIAQGNKSGDMQNTSPET